MLSEKNIYKYFWKNERKRILKLLIVIEALIFAEDRNTERLIVNSIIQTLQQQQFLRAGGVNNVWCYKRDLYDSGWSGRTAGYGIAK